MIFSYFLLCIGVLPIVFSFPQHDIDEDFSSIFQKDLVDDSIVVPLIHKTSRSKREAAKSEELQFNAYGKEFELYFEPDDHILMGSKTPIYLATGEKEGDFIDYKKLDSIKNKLRFQTLIDSKNKAAAVKFDKGTSQHLEGVIGTEYIFSTFSVNSSFDSVRIHQVPPSLKDDINVAFNQSILYIPPEDKDDTKIVEKNPRKVPETVYPEILVIADYTMLFNYKSSLVDLVKYIIGFWTAVDLRYREFESPKVRLNIAGIIIAQNVNATPYLLRVKDNEHTVHVAGDYSLTLMSTETTIPRIPDLSYDIIMLMSRRQLAGVRQTQLIPADGIAILGSACQRRNFIHVDYETDVSTSFQTVVSVGIIRDHGIYMASFAAAHELAHMLNAKHDGDRLDKNFRKCSADDGYIMNPGGEAVGDVGNNRFFFSKCSRDAITTFLREGKSQCLYNKPEVGETIQKPLPGLPLSLNEQCKQFFSSFGPARAVEVGHKACKLLRCKVYVEKLDKLVQIEAGQPPVEGTMCLPGKFCINGKCQAPPEVEAAKYMANVYSHRK